MPVVLWVGVTAASVIGVGAAFGRASAVIGSERVSQGGIIAGYDRMGVRIIAELVGIPPDSPRYRAHERDVAVFSRKYFVYSSATLLHVVPAAVLLILAPLQFVSSLRRRYAGLHRWSGRIVLVVLVPVGLSAFFFGTMPFGGISETLAVGLFGSVFLYAGGRAWLSIRRANVIAHREWMIRMMAVAIGVSTIRLVHLVLILTIEASSQAMFSPSLWIGWSLTLGCAEWWIRFTRRAEVPEPAIHEVMSTGI